MEKLQVGVNWTVVLCIWCCLTLSMPASVSTPHSRSYASTEPYSNLSVVKRRKAVGLTTSFPHGQQGLNRDILHEAAEFAIQSYLKRKNKLRGILGVEAEFRRGKNVYRLHLLYERQNGALQDRYFSVQFRRKLHGQVEFKLRSAKIRKRRSRNVKAKKYCNQFAKEANCSACGFHGICVLGTSRIYPWLEYALRTQRELQIDMPINRVQTLGSHNAFNNRASGYGDSDDCHWPVDEEEICISIANQEFSLTDQLKMGVRFFEIDLWKCFGKVRMSHGSENLRLGCFPWDKELADGLKEFSEWIRKPRNRKEIVELFLDDHTTSDDDVINDAIETHLGDMVLTPNDLTTMFNGQWPTTRDMRRVNKSVIIFDGANNHSGRYIHDNSWMGGFAVSTFLSRADDPTFGNPREITRIYSDSTRYGPFWSGVKGIGTIMDFGKYLSKGITIPCADEINPELLKTAVFTWAEGEPRRPLTSASCVILSRDQRWHVTNCTERHHFACVSRTDRFQWNISQGTGIYQAPLCPIDMEFSVPQNGYQHQQLVDSSDGNTVWLNLTQLIPLLKRN